MPSRDWSAVPHDPVRSPVSNPGRASSFRDGPRKSVPGTVRCEGDWAWTSPAGARQPGEAPSAAARRELLEEVGLELPLTGPLAHLTDDVALFAAEAPADAEIVLDAEHDRYEWVTLEEGVRRCLPAVVGKALRIADRAAAEGVR